MIQKWGNQARNNYFQSNDFDGRFDAIRNANNFDYNWNGNLVHNRSLYSDNFTPDRNWDSNGSWNSNDNNFEQSHGNYYYNESYFDPPDSYKCFDSDQDFYHDGEDYFDDELSHSDESQADLQTVQSFEQQNIEYFEPEMNTLNEIEIDSSIENDESENLQGWNN